MGHGAQAVVAVVAGERIGEAHVVELFDGPRREPVTARLLAGEHFFSTTTTSWPARASQYAVAAPAGPPPTTSTS